MKILVVDDHPLIVRALEESLPHVDSRFDVIAAANREQTLTALARYPDCALVLRDITLPGARGLDLLENAVCGGRIAERFGDRLHCLFVHFASQETSRPTLAPFLV